MRTSSPTNGPNGRGPWVAYTCTWYYAGYTTSVADIQSFAVAGSQHDVNLTFAIQPAQGPQSAAVYVSDNPEGPARLINVLTGPAVYLPQINNKIDSYRLPPGDQYYYWLDFDYGPFADRRYPLGLFAASGNAVVSGSPRIQFAPPGSPVATDVPFDQGGKITITWQLSSDDLALDSYNIYRNTYPPGQPNDEWYVLAALNRGVSSYLDQTTVDGWVTRYQVSAAHHGNYTLVPGRANEGIWNEFTPVVTGLSIDNFGFDQITLLSADPVVTCPAGDGGTLQAEVIIWGLPLYSGSTVGIPPAMIECHPQNEFASFCDGEPLIVDGPTDTAGRTTLTTSAIGGSGETDLIFKLANSSYAFDTLSVYLKSPDESGDGVVNIVDFTAFTTSYTSSPNPYAWQRDYNGDGTINVVDLAYFYPHYNHQCGSGGLGPSSLPVLSHAHLRLEFTESISASESRFLFVDVSAVDLTRFKAMVFLLRSDNPILAFERWEKGSFPGRVLVTPVTRDGVGEIAVGALDGENLREDAVTLGRLVFRINSSDRLELAARDFETRVAEVLSTSGDVSRMAGATTSDMVQIPRVVADALAQNRPNPFNPTTIISYSISQLGRVGLLVFGVDGKLVRTLVDRDQPPDRYDVVWDGADNQGQRVASGVYFCRLQTSQFTQTVKMVLLK